MVTIIEFAETQAAERGMSAMVSNEDLKGKIVRNGKREFETIDLEKAEHDKLVNDIVGVMMSQGCWKNDVFFF